MEKILEYTTAFSLLLLMSVVPFFVTGLLDHLRRFGEHSKFRLALSKAVSIKTPTIEEVKVVALRYHLSSARTYLCLLRLQSDCIEEKSGLKREYSEIFKSYYDQLKTEEPYDEIPEYVLYHLQKLRKILGANQDSLLPLAFELKALSVSNKRKEKIKDLIAGVGLIIGLLGTIFGAIPFLSN